MPVRLSAVVVKLVATTVTLLTPIVPSMTRPLTENGPSLWPCRRRVKALRPHAAKNSPLTGTKTAPFIEPQSNSKPGKKIDGNRRRKPQKSLSLPDRARADSRGGDSLSPQDVSLFSFQVATCCSIHLIYVLNEPCRPRNSSGTAQKL